MKLALSFILVLIILFGVLLTACKKEEKDAAGSIQLAAIRVGNENLDLQGTNNDVQIDSLIFIEFNDKLDISTAPGNLQLVKDGDTAVAFQLSFQENDKLVVMNIPVMLAYQSDYTIRITTGLKGVNGETFTGINVDFSTENGKLLIEKIFINGADFSSVPARDINYQNLNIEIWFSIPLDPDDYKPYFFVSGGFQKDISISDNDRKVTLTNLESLTHYNKYYFSVLKTLEAKNGFLFEGFNNTFNTRLDSSYKFPLVSDDELMDLIQQRTFAYFYDHAHPDCGLARERNTSGDIVTIGGSGFGVMALIVGMERGFITRTEGLDRMGTIISFLETCDRFHGAWPHWLYGSSGITRPFSENDDGADLVETSFMIQGLLTLRQYLDPGIPAEQGLIDRVNTLVDEVEWDWFTRDQDVLYWHWSPNVGWAMNMKIQGYNETLITYILAASSGTHGINAEVYHEGYARNGAIINGNSYYGYLLPLGYAYGGPLFFTHYSFLGLDPRHLLDSYADYWIQNVNHSLINWSYCVDNPLDWISYSTDCWGLTASDNPWGYSAHSPANDLGVVTPSAAVSALPYVPEQSMNAMRHFYYLLGDRLWGPYGFYDAFDVTEGWWADSYIAIDQGPIICMIENYRTGLLWNLFMSAPEVQQGLDKLGFSY